MLTQFSRTELLLGKEAMEKLSALRVAIFVAFYPKEGAELLLFTGNVSEGQVEALWNCNCAG